MREKYLVRGKGFVGDRLIKMGGEYLPRNWEGHFETVIYTAGYGNYYDQKDVYETYRVNVLEPLKLIQNCENFVYISTSSVLLPVQTSYSHSKKTMEEILENYENAVVIRPSSITGVGEQGKHLIPTLIRSCLYSEKMPFVSEPTHDFIDIEDFCRGLLYVSENIDQYKGKSLNLSSGINYSNQEVKEIVEGVTGKKANVKLVESMRKYDTDKWIVKPDLHFAKKTLYQSISEMYEAENIRNC